MKFLVLILLSSYFMSCSVGDWGKNKEGELNVNGNWIVAVIDNRIIKSDTDGTTLPVLEINVSQMRFSGSDGCNNFNGGITELDKKTIRFGLTAGTRMICLDMEIPDLFNRLLAEVKTWEVKKEKLHLFDADGNELMQLKNLTGFTSQS